MKITILAIALTLWPFFASANVTISDGWARASILASRPAAAYLTLTSDQSDQLVAITTPVAGNVTIHAVETGDDGVSRMVKIDALDLPSGEPVTLAPGSMHLMLMGLSEKLEEGTDLPLILTFASGARMEVNVPVLGPGAMGPQEEQS
ncbi:copper(I)-binding protein [Roseovarius sp. MBR-154]|jgi:copper(I)-binding protein|uniref:copper chaperone PCu(A)C n=1 Tax=Roseobacteraceae TaxID=2854170 RepID=UPI00237BA84A|nr:MULTISPECIES: copper chaperone PCu(A)C [Roseobacteraceae]MDD9745773.1 copper chaperone PCu(A)C [Marinovum sp. PR37]MDE4100196.1 copper chaperone PCu(A)C [Phaeobacter gallaeciensis]MDE4108997.1 copper chaperone PCu(A)C [Phaeobacter gallaeciensis]MDE4113442.1 copper chaperone PCu(A)C [Phaeobacter gallaeciensis]MDE4117900.1 copper chaperone PCu(A)C [Phaeobacter gallaeciensis]|tara:strand:- start:2854 stop:3297 length:444 start_codon:yes stop_codon:yes gene_type:complete